MAVIENTKPKRKSSDLPEKVSLAFTLKKSDFLDRDITVEPEFDQEDWLHLY